MPYTTTSGIDFIVEILRQRIADTKTVYTDVAQEDAGTATGAVAGEFFYTDNMPILSGADTHLRVGRWYYDKVDTDYEVTGLRAYTFNVASGAFHIPTGATAATSGDRVKLSYTWIEEQETRFRDEDLKFYIGDAVTIVNSVYYNFGHTFVADTVTGMYISPTPTASDFASYLYALYAAILIREEIEAESVGDRIYVRDINITIDTSKGLGDLSKSVKELRAKFDALLRTFLVDGQEAAFSRIDTYSTKALTGTYEYAEYYDENTESL